MARSTQRDESFDPENHSPQSVRSVTAIQLRAYAKGDFPALLSWLDSPETLRRWGGMHFTFPFDAEQFDRHLHQAPVALRPRPFVAYRLADGPGGPPVGYAELNPSGVPSYRVAELTNLIVAPEVRRQRVGLQLVWQVLAFAFDAYPELEGVFLWVLADNHAARACYVRAGFRPEAEQEPAPAVLGGRRREFRCMTFSRSLWDALRPAFS